MALGVTGGWRRGVVLGASYHLCAIEVVNLRYVAFVP